MIEYLSQTDIADVLGVSKVTVSQWRKRYSGFPPPDATIGHREGWLPQRIWEIRQWKRRTVRNYPPRAPRATA